jgi:hypothetical protein
MAGAGRYPNRRRVDHLDARHQRGFFRAERLRLGHSFHFLLAVPAAIVVFALLAPLAITTDSVLRGRMTRLINVVLGAALGVAAFTLYFAGSALLQLPTPFTPRRMIADGASLNALYRILAAPETSFILAQTVVILTSFSVAGMLVGLGLRHRAAIVRPA